MSGSELEIFELVKTGGPWLFAAVVWWELRTQRAERNDVTRTTNEVLATMSASLTSLLERDRYRSGPVRMPTLPGEPMP